jgi:LmbE family N-acetylglucosaminyl deacetylase
MEIFVPSGISEKQALDRTTHLAIAAHHDDIEIMAYHGILECFGHPDKWFSGVVVTDGSGSPRNGLYENCSDRDMMRIRKEEQKKAAVIGEYSAQVLLDFSSGSVKSPNDSEVIGKLEEIILSTTPEVIYTHNLADKHETHVGVAVKVIKALRELDFTPQKLYGCEVWRGLDWMGDTDKVKFDVAGHPNLESALVGVFDSQVCGGKRYDLATTGRRLANATYADSHNVDDTSALIYAMDLTPLIKDKNLDISVYATSYIDSFKKDVANVIGKLI